MTTWFTGYRLAAIVALAFGCASPASTTSTSALAPGHGSGDTRADSIYEDMGVAAASRIKEMASGRTVGMLRHVSDAFPGLHATVDAMIAAYGFREIRSGEAKITCTTRPARGRGGSAAVVDCGFDIADVLVQLNWLQIDRDSGYVGGYLTQVLKGESRSRSTAFCVVSARHGADWIGVQNTWVGEPRDCSRDRKH